MPGHDSVRATLVSLCLVLLCGVFAVPVPDIPLLSLPINLTSWKLSFRNALGLDHRPLVDYVNRTAHHYLDFFRNGSVGCVDEGEECIPGVPSCCGLFSSKDGNDTQCLQQNNSYRCSRLLDSEELAQQRLDGLEYGSAGVQESHPWVDSWEFQSRSEMEREEMRAAEEAEWQKKWAPGGEENLWRQLYKRLEHSGKEMWHDLKKMKKLKEIKAALIEKIKKRQGGTESPTSIKEGSQESLVIYPDEDKETGEENQSKESIIRFSDEIPKREKKVDFKIDDIIKDAVDLVDKKKYREGKINRPPLTSSPSEEEPFNLKDVKVTEDKLMKEINEMKKLKEKHEEKKEEQKDIKTNLQAVDAGLNIDELIKRQVAAILEEERKLERLRKMEELKKLEEGV